MRRIALGMLAAVLFACGGKVGPAGAKGETGAPGLTITGEGECSASQGGYLFLYETALFGDGSRWTRCQVSNGTLSATDTELYRSGSAGATAGTCFMVLDSDSTATGGTWNFALVGTGATATYKDVGSAINGQVVAMTCTVH